MNSIDSAPGRFGPMDADAGVFYKTEADLRDAAAKYAWMHGWTAEIEVPTVAGGRCDLLVHNDTSDVVFCIEIKKELKTPRQFRLGFQQADGYRRHFHSRFPDKGVVGFLMAPRIDFTVGRPISRLYSEVDLAGWWDLIQQLNSGYSAPSGQRARIAACRARDLEQAAALARSCAVAVACSHRSTHLLRLRRNYPAMSAMLMKELAA